MGADGFIETQVPDWQVPHELSFDLILSTASSDEGFDIALYLSMLNVHGKFVSVGLPEGKGWQLRPQSLLSNGCLIGSSHLGSRRETVEMLKLAEEKGIKSWVETLPVGEDGCGQARELIMAQTQRPEGANFLKVERVHKNDIRYRFTLVDYEKQFS